jgi:SAM-dependent methyltransferase
MNFPKPFRRGLMRLAKLKINTRGYYYGDFHRGGSGVTLYDRWRDAAQIADFRSTDSVLDVGCAEGLITFEVARHVAHVDGIDVMPHRAERAQRAATERKITNVCISAGSLTGYPLEPLSYDVVLALSVIGKTALVVRGSKAVEADDGGRIGVDELKRLLRATRRQIILRANVQDYDRSNIMLQEIVAAMNECDFDAICFSRTRRLGNLIAGNRRGADARLRTVPPLVLVPTENMRDHPCLHGAHIGSYADFA